MRLSKYGIFCERYGKTLRNLAWEHFLCNSETTAGNMAREEGISRPKAYQIIAEFLKKKYIVKSRVFGKTQLYKLNNENEIVKIFRRNFNECVESVVDEYKPKKHTSNGDIKISLSAKGL